MPTLPAILKGGADDVDRFIAVEASIVVHIGRCTLVQIAGQADTEDRTVAGDLSVMVPPKANAKHWPNGLNAFIIRLKPPWVAAIA
jgi:hypothetical protein